jgi:hypothetical protein
MTKAVVDVSHEASFIYSELTEVETLEGGNI